MDFVINNPHQNNMYQNQQYSFDREERKTLIIMYRHSEHTDPHKAILHEPFIIDKLSDVYLESFTTHNANTSTEDPDGHQMIFVIDIDEFNINSNSNLSNLSNKIIIPNELSSGVVVKSHKAKKLNYICSINPTKLTELNITIKSIYDTSDNTFHPMFTDGNGRYILELVFISRK